MSPTTLASFLLILLPWLNPFSLGPSPAVVPLLFSWACAAALLAVGLASASRGSGERLVSTTAAAWLVGVIGVRFQLINSPVEISSSLQWEKFITNRPPATVPIA